MGFGSFVDVERLSPAEGGREPLALPDAWLVVDVEADLGAWFTGRRLGDTFRGSGWLSVPDGADGADGAVVGFRRDRERWREDIVELASDG